ncbi:MAG: YIP1 family protein [Candidatus Aminicenantes bacterium]|nr:YIP1 family protein [Candidatus Aminicenantes bacterium]
MDIVARVQAIVLKPKEEWARIKAEPATVPGLFKTYIMVLAAVPAAAQLIGHIIVGTRLPMVGRYRWPVGSALASAILTYVLALASVYLFALIINELAPSFASAKNMTAALKLAAYSMTPGWVAGILYVVPGLSPLVILGTLYGVYVLYLGFEAPMMGTPKDKVPAYLGISFVVAVALFIVLGWFVRMIFAVRYGRL